MAVSPLAVQQLAETVLGCVCATLEAVACEVADQPGCPCRACVVPGASAWDGCNDLCGARDPGGQLTVHVARIHPTVAFPLEDRQVQGVRNCAAPTAIAVDLVVTLLRCAPTLDESGCPPPAGSWPQPRRSPTWMPPACSPRSCAACPRPGRGGGDRSS